MSIPVFEFVPSYMEQAAIVAAGDILHRQRITLNEMLLDAADLEKKPKPIPHYGVAADKGHKNLRYLADAAVRRMLADTPDFSAGR